MRSRTSAIVATAALLLTLALVVGQAITYATLSDRIADLREAQAEPAVTVEPVELDETARIEAVMPSVYTLRSFTSQGTGFVVDVSNGRSTLLTAAHVVEDAWYDDETVEVVGPGQRYRGTVDYVDLGADLATVVVDAELEPLALCDHEVTVGEAVLVVGSPYGLKGTAATGIVSAIRPRYIQFSAPVSPGSSGGPVVGEDGMVVGVVDQKVVTAAAEGLAFAVPVSAEGVAVYLTGEEES
jgi:putative serine protease PepD